jgi:hypothetical protein
MWRYLQIQIEWIEDQRQKGLAVSRLAIRIKAKKMAKEGLSSTPTFGASAGWCTRFMRRNGLSLRQKTKMSQKLPEELHDKIQAFQRYVIRQRTATAFPLNRIGNMDETPMYFDMQSSQTVDTKGVKTVQIKTTGHEKTHFTVVLPCMVDGGKLPPMVIFKRKTQPKGNFPPRSDSACPPQGLDGRGICPTLDEASVGTS